MSSTQVFKLLFLSNLIGSCVFVNDPQFDIMRYISKMLTDKYSKQAAIAYVKPIGEYFSFNLNFSDFHGEYLVQDDKQRYIAARPHNGTHSEKLIFELLPELIKKTAGNEQVDLYLFTLNSPCCSPYNGFNQRIMNYYLPCSKYSCSALISNFAINELKRRLPIRYMYLSWKQPFVSKHLLASPPARSVLYYQRYFYSIRQFLYVREQTKGRLVLLLEEPQTGNVKKLWFQKVLAACLFGKRKYFKQNKEAVYRFINYVTAKCVVLKKKDSNLIGAENSFLDKSCWTRYDPESATYYKLPIDKKDWKETLKPCLDEIEKEINVIILGPPLNPEQGEGDSPRFVVSQNLEDLKLDDNKN